MPLFCRRILPLTILLLILAAGASAQTWTLAWSDEFNGAANSQINPANWEFQVGINNVNNELEYYCGPATTTGGCNPASPNAYIDGNGHLVIQALMLNSNTAPYSGSWTSARLDTGNNLQNLQYGRMESSMALPIGPGIWPAFWALGTNIGSVGWPSSGEMDFMENVPAASGLGPSTIKSTIHGGVSSSNCYCGGNGLGRAYTFPSNDANGPDVTTFHIYGAIWSANMVQFYVDDPANIFFVRTASDVPAGFTWDFNHPFYGLLNLAVGGTGSWPGPPDSTTPNPAVMTVDYVRYYTPSQVTAPTLAAPPISLTAGQSAPTTLTINSAAGMGRMYLACATNAPKATCAVSSSDALNQYTVDFTSASSATATLTVNTTANTASAISRNQRAPWLSGAWVTGVWVTGVWAAGAFLLFVPLLAQARCRTVLRGLPGLQLLVVLLTIVLLTSCGGSSGNSTGTNGSNGTPPGSYTITVSAYTVSNTTGTPDSTLAVPLTVN